MPKEVRLAHASRAPFSRLISIAALSAALVTGLEPVVLACSAPVCPYGYVVPRAGKVIPANAPALFLRQSASVPVDSDGGTDQEAAVQLVAGDGQIIPVSLQPDPASPYGQLIIPSGPLPLGTMHFQVGFCGPSVAPADYTFDVSPAVPLPSTIGTLEIGRSLRGLIDSPSSGPCREPIDGAMVVVDLRPSPELERYAELVRLVLTVDGSVWAAEPYGRAFSSNAIIAGHRVDRIYGRCSPSPGAAASSGLAPGSHTAQLSAHVAGATSDPPPISFSFALDCGVSPTPDGGVPGDAPDAQVPPGSDAVVSTPDGTDPDSAMAINPVSDPMPRQSSGCSAAPVGPGSVWPLLMMAVVLVRRRYLRSPRS